MTTEKQIQKIIEEAIPLNPTCEIERKKEIERRARARIELEQLLRELKPYEPRTETK